MAEPPERLRPIVATHVGAGLQVGADTRSLRPTKQAAPILLIELDAPNPSGFPLGHARDG